MPTPLQVLRHQLSVLETFKLKVLSQEKLKVLRGKKDPKSVEDLILTTEAQILDFKEAIKKLNNG